MGDRTAKPIDAALKAANMTLADLHGVELIGGGMRVPKVQESIQKTLGDDLILGMHINSDESMALGVAFHGANVSTAFKVRHVGMTDINPFPILVNLENLDANDKKKKKKKNDDDAWSKHATIFKANGKVGVKKTIAFTHDSDVSCAVEYDDDDNFQLPEGTASAIETYNVRGVAEFAKEMTDKGLGKPKVALQFELSTSGLVDLVKAEATVEETYMVDEEVEVDDEEEENETATEGEEGEKKEEAEAEGEAAAETESEKEGDEKEENPDDSSASSEEEKKNATEEEKPKKKKTITVQKEKKKVHKRTLTFDSYHSGSIQPYSADIMAESKAKLAELARKDKERMDLEEIRNTYESYIYLIKNKLIDDEDAIAAVSTQEQRDYLSKSAMEAEDWMYDEGYDADLETYTKKYEELSAPAEKVFFRVKEVPARAEAVDAMNKKLDKVVALMTKWETTMPQVTEEERADVISKVDAVRQWMADKVEAQASADPADDPVFVSADVPKQTSELQAVISKLSKRPKPAPKEEKKNETDADAKSDDKESEEESKEESKEGEGEESKEEETKDSAAEDE